MSRLMIFTAATPLLAVVAVLAIVAGVAGCTADTKDADGQREQAAARLKSQVHEHAFIEAGQTAVLTDLQGAGTVRRIWLALSSGVKNVVEDDSRLRIYVNGQDTPSVDVPVSQFFGYTHEADPFVSEAFASPRKHYVPEDSLFERGAYRYVDIPFARGLRVTLEVGDGDLRFWSTVAYHEGLTPPDGSREAHFQAAYLRDDAVTPYTHVELAHVQGRGRLESLVLSTAGPDHLAFLEGNLEVYVDGEDTPSIYAPGTEDITGDAFYFEPDPPLGPYQGTTVSHYSPPSRFTQYRVFERDRIEFDESLRLVWMAGQRGQGELLEEPLGLQATVSYYLDSTPGSTEPAEMDLVLQETFDGEDGSRLAWPWAQDPSTPPWRQEDGRAVYRGTSAADAWAYHAKADQWPDQVVEADVRINNFGQGEVWLFMRGTEEPGFEERITWGFSAFGTEGAHPNYQPVFLFVADTSPTASSLLLLPAGKTFTLRMESRGEQVIASIKERDAVHFREVFRVQQAKRNDGVSGISAVRGDIAVEDFRVYQTVAQDNR